MKYYRWLYYFIRFLLCLQIITLHNFSHPSTVLNWQNESHYYGYFACVHHRPHTCTHKSFITASPLLNERREYYTICWLYRWMPSSILLSFHFYSSVYLDLCLCFSHLLLVKLRSVTHPPSCDSRSNIGRKAYLLGWQTWRGKACSVKYLGDFSDWLGYLARLWWPGWPPNEVGCFAHGSPACTPAWLINWLVV